MNDGHWDRLEELFHRALPLSPGERARLLEQECGEDPALCAEVERLLSAADRAGSFIHEPAIAARGLSLEDVDADSAGRRIGAYRLIRQVGRGGMGAVYLAERHDGGFDQRVAIKLIKRGMDTDMVLARFRAERQILASLDHPNIARLLDGGTTDDGLPFFAMEYIEGQPIDRFAESRHLGLEERLRLFLPVCDAVSYAHGRGVIHRDIKPFNTLVTADGVPKLLDFGVAKLLHGAPDEITTITGLRLLTPDYASPEQIEGARATEASDVYSLGVVLYELVTGRSPYRVANRTPQEIAAAVCTTEPDRPSTAVTQPADGVNVRWSGPATDPRDAQAGARQLSRRLRGDLDTIVLTALRKEPGRRYASAAALADDIRRHLEGRPIEARAEDVTYRAGKFVRRHRALLGSAAMSAALVTAAWQLMAGSSGSGRSDSSLLATNSLAPRDRIVVADFADRAGDSLLVAALTEAFRTDLAQSPVVRVMTPRQVSSSLTRMEKPPDLGLDDSLARELAIREGVKGIVTGSLARISGRYALTVQLVAAQSGEALAAIRETASDSMEIIPAADRASKALRRRIGESLRELEAMPALHQVTTRSLPALKLYSEAQRLGRQGRRTEAVVRFEQAVALDPGFASAHLGMALVYGALGDAGRSDLAGDRAMAHRDRLPFVERSFLIGSRAHSREDWDTAIRTYSDLLRRYPDHIAALNNLALAYRQSRRYAVAESLFAHAFRIDSTVANLLFGVHGAQVLQGRFDEADATLDTLARRFPGHPIYLTQVMQDAAAEQDWAGAEQAARSHIAALAADTLMLVDPHEALAQMAMLQGRLAEAERHWTTHHTLTQAAGALGRQLFGALQRGYLSLRYLGDTTRAVARVDSALAALPLHELLPGDRRYDEVARFYLAAGRIEEGREYLAAAEANDSARSLPPTSEREWTRGVHALSQGQTGRAIERLERAAATHPCGICLLPDLGRAYEAAGRRPDAVAVYERYLTGPWLWRYEPDAVALVPSLVRLAQISEQMGNPARARSAYRQVLDLWRRADPALAPSLHQVRTRLSDLSPD